MVEIKPYKGFLTGCKVFFGAIPLQKTTEDGLPSYARPYVVVNAYFPLYDGTGPRQPNTGNRWIVCVAKCNISCSLDAFKTQETSRMARKDHYYFRSESSHTCEIRNVDADTLLHALRKLPLETWTWQRFE